MNKKGFTLIELLAVIVILAVIALIVTPVVTTIISSAKESANARSVEGHIKNVEYAIITNSFKDGMSNPTLYDGKKTESDLNFTYPSNDNIRCESYDIENGMVKVAYKCKDSSWKDTYKYEQGKNAYKDSTGGSVGLVGTPIGEKVLTAFPQLEMGTNGCKVDYPNNYSYMGGCYLRGIPSSNYLWYSGNFWRIMGINQDGTIKLITEENVTVLPYNKTGYSNFDTSHADKWLNDYFISKLKGSNIILSNDFCQGRAIDSGTNPNRIDCTDGVLLNKRVGLLSIDEYYLAGGKNSYLKNNQFFYTMSPYFNISRGTQMWIVNEAGDIGEYDYIYPGGYRPIINISNKTIITGGNGTFSSNWTNESSPYILNEDKTTSSNGLLNTTATFGEYVKLANKIYRVVSKDNNGNVKLILDQYYQEPEGTDFIMRFNDQSSNTYSLTKGIGQKLNNDVLNWMIPTTDTNNRNKLVTDYTWYQNDFVAGDLYTVSLNETNPTRSINATVGLIRMGEMLASQSYTMLTKNGTVASSTNNITNYWTLTPDNGTDAVWSIRTRGDALNYSSYSFIYSLRPVIVVKSNTTITSGKGLPFSPYEI